MLTLESVTDGTSCICGKVAKSGNLYYHGFFSVSKQLVVICQLTLKMPEEIDFEN